MRGTQAHTGAALEPESEPRRGPRMPDENQRTSISPCPSRRGAVSRGCLIAGGVGAALLLFVVILGSVFAGKYNQIKAGHVKAEAKWAEIDNQYKRPYD